MLVHRGHAEEARARLFALPGSCDSDPELSWRFEVAPAGPGFVHGRALGPQLDGSLWLPPPGRRVRAAAHLPSGICTDLSHARLDP